MPAAHHIVTGELIQETAGVFIGTMESLIYNPRFRRDARNLELSAIPESYSNPTRVFVYSHDIAEFSAHLHKFTVPFTLISHNSDGNIVDCPSTRTILDCPLVLKWFAQNVCVDHEKITPLPLGIANSMWSHGSTEIFDALDRVAKTNSVFFNFAISTNPAKRQPCYDALKTMLPFLPVVSPEDNMRRLATYKFCICPEGNGIDTHRFWEAVYLRCIPIVLDTPTIRLFQKHTRIPVVVLNSWSDLDVSKLEYSYTTYLPDISLQSYVRQIMKPMPVTIVLTSLVNFQEYILDSVRNLQFHGNRRIVVITESAFFSRFAEFPDVELVDASTLHDEFEFASRSQLDTQFRGGFWHLASARLFVLYAYLKKTGLCNCLHIENDVVVYANADTVRWNPNRMSVVFDSLTRVVPSVVWVPYPDTLRGVLDHYDPSKNDMQNLARFDLEHLPIFPDSWTLGASDFAGTLKDVTEQFPVYDYVFDGAAIGQYLGGVDPRNSPGDTRGFINETCIIKYDHYPVTWRHCIPYLNVGGREYRIFNLHIHSKNLREFTGRDWMRHFHGDLKWDGPHIGVCLMGGLGNQLFQFAAIQHISSTHGFAPRLSQIHNSSPHATMSYFDTILKNWKRLPKKEGLFVREPDFNYRRWDKLREYSSGFTLQGYFQDHRYVDDDFADTLVLPTEVLTKYPDIGSKVFLHVRGGDYHGNADLDMNLDAYYARAIAKFPGASFAIFTNDEPYLLTRPWLEGLDYTIIRENELDSLTLMSKCAGAICANSTFSWWGAWLNRNRTIVFPSRWVNASAKHKYEGLYFPGVQTCEVEAVSPIDLYCIHLPHRKDRRAHMDAMQAKYPSVKIHYVDGVYDPTSYLGCQLSHKKCVQMAKDAGWPYVIVLEDDCDFWLPDSQLRQAFETMIEYYTSHPEVEIVNGCGNIDPLVITSCEAFKQMYFLTSPKVYTGHCILYGDRVYDKVLAVEPGILIDAVQSQWNIVYTYPYLATQIPSYSDLVQENVDYVNIRRSRSFVENHIKDLKQ
jgi:hypothetical protein